MPTIEVSYQDICSLIGQTIPKKEFQEKAVLFAKGEIDEWEGDSLKIDIKDTNRPDLWSAEGIAREIQGRYGNPGLPEYSVKKSDLKVIVDKKMKNIRPCTVCAVVKNLKITEHVLSQIIQLQEKVSISFGRNRKEVAIGIYDLCKIKPPIKFTAFKPDQLKFTPLDFKEELTLKEILEKHPKGKEYGFLLSGLSEYPIFIDSANEVLSMPPIINSEYTGKVTKETRNVFIECSGFNLKFLLPALNTIVCALADRGGEIFSADIIYPDKKLTTPDLKPKTFSVNANTTNKLSGLNLQPEQICTLLEQARYKTKTKGNKIDVIYPAYRQDIMHERDVIEDVIISYGFNNIEPVVPRLPTTGGQEKIEEFSYLTEEIMTGLGFQQTMSYTLTNKESLFKKMNLPEKSIVEIENPISSNWSVFRNSLLPSILEFLSKNKHREYPQRIFETGDIVITDETKETKTKNIRNLACAVTHPATGYEEISSCLDAFFLALGKTYELKETAHPSFIQGRAAEIIVNRKSVGIIGEIHPKVLNNWELENPVAAWEINLESILSLF